MNISCVNLKGRGCIDGIIPKPFSIVKPPVCNANKYVIISVLQEQYEAVILSRSLQKKDSDSSL